MSFSDLIVQLRTALSGDVTTRIVIAAAITVLLAAFVAGAVAIARTLSPRGRLRALLESEAASEPRPAWAMRLVAVALVAFALFGTRIYLSSSATCAQCHAKSPEASALAQTPHKAVACGDCHGGSGATGTLRLGIDYIRWTSAWVSAGKLPKDMTAEVSNTTCLGCHGDIGPTRVVGGLRVRHADFLDDGSRCLSCHAGLAHPNVKGGPSGPTMASCLPCHDGTRAPSACETCHTKDLTQRDRDGVQMAQLQVSGGKDACYTCHAEKPCLRCHGVHMPHPDGWSPKSGAPLGGTHARAAFVDRQLCWRCHYEGKPGTPSAQACSCHRWIAYGGMHGGQVWVQEHGLEATGRKEGYLADCFTCHGENLCTNCHPASYTKLYNPKLGVDHYKRETPMPAEWKDL